MAVMSGAGKNFLVTQSLSATGRVTRSPQHSFNLRTRPFAISPFMIAPVMPGETLKRFLMQARVVSDPVANPLIGWWKEYYWFYVKHRDLDDRDELTQMMLDPAWTIADVDSTTAVPQYYFAGNATVPQIDWVGKCLKRVVEEYFRAEGESWNNYTIDGLPAAAVNRNDWFDSVNDVGTAYPDVAVDGADGSAADDAITASEVDAAMRQWQFQRLQGLTEMTYEDWLATYGVHTPKVEVHRPELLRYVRDWTYPTNTVDPATGAPSSAMSWSFAESSEKSRYFAEPGFILGVTVARPKLYFGKQRGAGVALLQDWATWLPAAWTNDRAISLRQVAANAGIVKDAAAAFTVDVRDLFLYGDQFLNYVLGTGTPDVLTTGVNAVSMPGTDLRARYPANLAEVQGVFAGSTDATRFVREDGLCTLHVLGRQVDQT